MSIIKPTYELSVWEEVLNSDGTKSEKKQAIIGADDMTALGRATSVQLKRELKGQNTLTFQMPSKYFDPESGDYVRNELAEYLCNEKKVKLLFEDEWYEFYVKKIDEKKQFKSIMYSYTCNDAFIEELSRNGYGITFDTDLYNNVEELGVFSDTILNDNTIWDYDASKNWGDFTEYTEEKLYKIDASLLDGLAVYKIALDIPEKTLTNDFTDSSDYTLTNVYTGETRIINMSDDKARELRYFWNNKKKPDNNAPTTVYSRGFDLLQSPTTIGTDVKYIYFPYSQLQYVYNVTDTTTDTKYKATATAQLYPNRTDKLALSAYTDDPAQLIQMLIIPDDAEVSIDEDGLLTNTNFHYVTTIQAWEKFLKEDKNVTLVEDQDGKYWPTVYSEGYLDNWGVTTVNLGKKVSITDRTEINISEDIDRYVTVYNNPAKGDNNSFIELWTDETFLEHQSDDTFKNFWLCSYSTSRSIVPQLARNYVQNGTNITESDGWEFAKVDANPLKTSPSLSAGTGNEDQIITTISESGSSGKWYISRYNYKEASYEYYDQSMTSFPTIPTSNLFDTWADAKSKAESEGLQVGGGTSDYYVQIVQYTTTELADIESSTSTGISGLLVTIPGAEDNEDVNYCSVAERSVLNFGLVGQEMTIEANKFYAFKIALEFSKNSSTIEDKDDTSNATMALAASSQTTVMLLGKATSSIIKKYDQLINGTDENSKIKRLANLLKEIDELNANDEINQAISDEIYQAINDAATLMQDLNSNNSLNQDSYGNAKDSIVKQINILQNLYNTKATSEERQYLREAINILSQGLIDFTPSLESDSSSDTTEETDTTEEADINTSEEQTDIALTQQIIIKIGNGAINPNGYYSLTGDIFYSKDSENKLIPTTEQSQVISFSYYDYTQMIKDDNYYLLISPTNSYDTPYIQITFPQCQETVTYKITDMEFFEAYTRGVDSKESREEDLEDSDFIYKYSGRDFNYDKSKDLDYTGYFSNVNWVKIVNKRDLLLETDVTLGDVFEYERYYLQALEYTDKDTKTLTYKDTFKLTSFVTEDTNYFDLGKCKYYTSGWMDCCYSESGTDNVPNRECLFQKYGYCPYRFQTEKHPRRIRTLTGEKSNRFNLIQELSKVFEIYPMFYIKHKNNGKVEMDENGKMIKKVFFITEKGMENKIGFRYEKNLSNITRTIDSSSITTKMYVSDVDSSLSDTGLCTIKLAEDNPSKDSFLIDYSYYIEKGLMNKDVTEKELYGSNPDQTITTENEYLNADGFLPKLGYLNGQYDTYSNLIINMQDESYTELQANIETNFTAIEEAIKLLNDYQTKLNKYKNPKKGVNDQSDSFNNTLEQYKEQYNILSGLIGETFGKSGTEIEGSVQLDGIALNDNSQMVITLQSMEYYDPITNQFRRYHVKDFLEQIIWQKTGDDQYNSDWKTFKETYLDMFLYNKYYGLFGQFQGEYEQIQEWKKIRASYLKQINSLTAEYYKKYEPFLKEGTWSDSNYLSDNTYYWGAKAVLTDSCKPNVKYTISVIDLHNLPEYQELYTFNLADTTYVEDIEMFGADAFTGLPNRIKVLISSITYNLDNPSKNSIGVQNYTTAFEDLMSSVSATVQSLSFNENTYKRASNFTATQEVQGDSLQGALDNNTLTLVNTDEDNITIDEQGQSGSDINNHAYQYKLTGEGLFFSKNGGQSWDTGVTPNGINASYIKVGDLDASKISIIDGNYLYFMWDKTGITAYRDPKTTGQESTLFGDYARFNKMGLSIVEDHKIKLRAGYNYEKSNNSDYNDGDIRGELDISSQEQRQDTDGNLYVKNTQRNIGFYLYDNKGNVIFKSENSEDGAAQISLLGELQVSDTTLSETKDVMIYNYSDGIEATYHAAQSSDEQKLLKDNISGIFTNNGFYTSLEAVGKNIKITIDNSTYYTNFTNPDTKSSTKISERVIKCSNGTMQICKKRYLFQKYTKIEKTTTNSTTDSSIETITEENYHIELWVYSIVDANKTTDYYRYNDPSSINDDTFITTTKATTIPAYYKITGTPIEDVTNLDSSYKSTSIYLLDKDKTEITQATSQTVYFSSDNSVDKPIDGQPYIFYLTDSSFAKTEDNKKVTETITYTDGAQLLLNNMNVNSGTARDLNERLFSAFSTSATEGGKNILTILKNGNLYIGGVFNSDNFNGQTLTNTLTITDAPLEYDSSNKVLKMEFNTIQDSNGRKLGDFIQDSIYDMKGQITDWINEQIIAINSNISSAQQTASAASEDITTILNDISSFKTTYNKHTHTIQVEEESKETEKPAQQM
jgi:hypothetical protein